MFSTRPSFFLGACLAGILAATTLSAPRAVAAEGPSSSAQAESELDAAFRAAGAAAQYGPTAAKLGDQATLELPEGFAYVPPKESARLMYAMGNGTGEGLLGMVFPTGEREENWFVVIEFDQAGYIKDDDAKDWDADQLLESLKEGTEEANKQRVARGIPALEVLGWVERPLYDAAAHHLVWSIAAKDKGEPDGSADNVNYNTYALGREGYISMNLVTGLDAIGQDKEAAKILLAGLSFNDGKRYADFDASTDKVAAYGLAALVGGVAAKKLGLFAMLGLFLAKFWKLVVVGAAAGGGVLAKFLTRGKGDARRPG